MADIFVSYARQDRGFSQRFVKALESRGFSVFWDSEIRTGQEWRDEIEANLDAARCVIVIWSEKARKSKWVKEEADSGKERGILIPIRIDASTLPLGFRGIQTADFSQWSPGGDGVELEALVRHVARIVQPSRPRPSYPKDPPAPVALLPANTERTDQGVATPTGKSPAEAPDTIKLASWIAAGILLGITFNLGNGLQLRFLTVQIAIAAYLGIRHGFRVGLFSSAAIFGLGLMLHLPGIWSQITESPSDNWSGNGYTGELKFYWIGYRTYGFTFPLMASIGAIFARVNSWAASIADKAAPIGRNGSGTIKDGLALPITITYIGAFSYNFGWFSIAGSAFGLVFLLYTVSQVDDRSLFKLIALSLPATVVGFGYGPLSIGYPTSAMTVTLLALALILVTHIRPFNRGDSRTPYLAVAAVVLLTGWDYSLSKDVTLSLTPIGIAIIAIISAKCGSAAGLKSALIWALASSLSLYIGAASFRTFSAYILGASIVGYIGSRFIEGDHPIESLAKPILLVYAAILSFRFFFYGFTIERDFDEFLQPVIALIALALIVPFVNFKPTPA